MSNLHIDRAFNGTSIKPKKPKPIVVKKNEAWVDIEWRGAFDMSGYGIWGRKLCKVLAESGKYRVKPVSMRGRLEKTDELFYLQDLQLDDPIRVENIIPLFPLRSKKSGYCTCTELRKPPPEQVVNMNKADFVLALSSFSTNAYKSVVNEPEKIFQVNFPMFKGEYSPKGISLQLSNLDKYKFKFMTVGRIDVRKNLETLIRCFTEEFGNNPSVCLILKVYSPDYCVPLWIKKHKPSNNIFWFDQRIPDMSVLYRSVNAYITTDLGEAWSGPTQEAMLCGIPAIAPRHSGHLDYMNSRNSWLINVSDWKEIGHRENNLYERLLPSYGEVKYPLEDSIKFQMRRVYNQFKDKTREEVLSNPRIINALKSQEKAKASVILKQLNKCFDWVTKKYGK